MTEIPNDIMAAALEVYSGSDRDGVRAFHIAEAIFTERKRCAEVAKRECIEQLSEHWWRDDVAETVAKRILEDKP